MIPIADPLWFALWNMLIIPCILLPVAAMVATGAWVRRSPETRTVRRTLYVVPSVVWYLLHYAATLSWHLDSTWWLVATASTGLVALFDWVLRLNAQSMSLGNAPAESSKTYVETPESRRKINIVLTLTFISAVLTAWCLLKAKGYL